ncbi:MAG: hypothetical protein AAGI68_02800 [Planctomycetota bacterium]
MIRTATTAALALSLTAAGSAFAGTHSLFVLENDGYTSFAGFDFTVTLDDAGSDWEAIINNASTDGTSVTGIYFEVDMTSGLDWDWSQYGLSGSNAEINTFADDSSFSSPAFTSLAGFAGMSGTPLDGATVNFDKHDDNDSDLSDLDSTIGDVGYRIVYTVSDGTNSAVLITGLSGHAVSPDIVPVAVTGPVAMPTPTAALAGFSLLGALVARRRRHS